jgi:hypothetical protein
MLSRSGSCSSASCPEPAVDEDGTRPFMWHTHWLTSEFTWNTLSRTWQVHFFMTELSRTSCIYTHLIARDDNIYKMWHSPDTVFINCDDSTYQMWHFYKHELDHWDYSLYSLCSELIGHLLQMEIRRVTEDQLCRKGRVTTGRWERLWNRSISSQN